MTDDKMVWVDIETLGLSQNSPIIELGFTITDLNLKVVESKAWTVWGELVGAELGRMKTSDNPNDEYVLKMHTQNNLLEEALAANNSSVRVQSEAIRFLDKHSAVNLPMCGSSVHTDRMWLRAQMRTVHNMFHYRNIDTSTLKELCRLYNPRVYSALPPKVEAHRVLSDLMDTIAEFKHYRDEFLLW